VLFKTAPVNPWNLKSAQASDWMIQGSLYNQSLIVSQSSAIFTFVLAVVVSSSTFLHRTAYLYEFIPLKNVVWLGMSIFVILLQLAFSAGFIASQPQVSLAGVEWVLAIVFGMLIPIVGAHEVVKSMDKKEFTRFQKRSKLEFNTKLGCYSPV
jgi:magnesium-transporting ATPase (P-type)